MKRWLAVLFGALLLFCSGAVWKVWDGLRAKPMVEELADREPAVPAALQWQATGPFVVSGVVITDAGEGAERTVSAYTPFTNEVLVEVVSDPEDGGYFELALDRPAWVGVSPQPVDAGDLPFMFTQDVEGLEFLVPESCPVSIEVLDPDGNPYEGATVKTRVNHPDWPRQHLYATTDGDGYAQHAGLMCGTGKISVMALGFAAVRVDLDTQAQDHVLIQLEEGVTVSGTVVDQEGQPVPSGNVSMNDLYPGVPFTDGVYEVQLVPGTWNLRFVGDEEGNKVYSSFMTEVEVSGDQVVDVELERFQAVEVYCAGLPDDQCVGVVPIRCDQGLVPAGRTCWDAGGGVTECRCPLQDAVVRSPETHVIVGPDDSRVWLDYRDKGSIVGVVSGCPSPGECFIMSGQLAVGKTGTPPARGTLLGPEGTFGLHGLDAGTWGVAVGWSGGVLDLPDVTLDEGEQVDLGVIDIGGSGGVKGLVVDGLTGEPRPWESVVVRSADHDSAVNPLGSVAVSMADGTFELTGLPSGDYEVFLLRRPLERIDISIGGALEDVVLETAEANVLDEQGFGVDDELVVTGIDEGGWAEEAGLLEGDRIVGVTLMGIDSTLLDPKYSEQAAQTVLRHYSGNLDLVVERDGQLYDVGLD